MKTLATLVLLLALAAPATAAIVHDEAVDGDLSSLAAAPTALLFTPGGNTVTGTVRNSNNVTTGDRDFITFTVPAGNVLTGLNLLAYAPAFLSFAAFNAGVTSFVPGIATDASFLAGIHISGSELGMNLMPLFVGSAVTTNSLAAPQLDPGDYCFVIQQTGTALQSYSLEFVLDGPVPVDGPTWGAIKALYR